jgi:hypothetical protein
MTTIQHISQQTIQQKTTKKKKPSLTCPQCGSKLSHIQGRYYNCNGTCKDEERIYILTPDRSLVLAPRTLERKRAFSGFGVSEDDGFYLAQQDKRDINDMLRHLGIDPGYNLMG